MRYGGGEGGRERQGERCVCVYKKTGIRWKERVTNRKQSKNGTETDEKNDELTDKQQHEIKMGSVLEDGGRTLLEKN